MGESGIAQLYVVGSDESRLQVATVPTMEDVTLGFVADKEGDPVNRFRLTSANSEIVTSNIGSGIYIVRLQNAQVNDVRKVIIK